MNYENLPRSILAASVCLITGFVLALWCMPLLDKKPRIANHKPGFSIAFPASQLKSPMEANKLAGKQVKILRTSEKNADSCVIDHAPLMLQMQDQFVFLSSGFEALENFVINISLADLRSPELVEFPTATPQRFCLTHPKVTYGE